MRDDDPIYDLMSALTLAWGAVAVIVVVWFLVVLYGGTIWPVQ